MLKGKDLYLLFTHNLKVLILYITDRRSEIVIGICPKILSRNINNSISAMYVHFVYCTISVSYVYGKLHCGGW